MALADELRANRSAVREAADAEEALTISGALSSIELMITDLHIPGRVRASCRSIEPVIASAHAKASVAVDAADALFERPYDIPALLDKNRPPRRELAIGQHY
jgi:hypothetical protein